jgi:hypothetical protein
MKALGAPAAISVLMLSSTGLAEEVDLAALKRGLPPTAWPSSIARTCAITGPARNPSTRRAPDRQGGEKAAAMRSAPTRRGCAGCARDTRVPAALDKARKLIQ